MANQVKITIKKVKELKPEEKREWKRDYLSRKTARKTAHNDRVRENLANLRRSLRKAVETGEIEPRRPMIRSFDVLVQFLCTLAVGDGFRAEALRERILTTHAFATMDEQEERFPAQQPARHAHNG